MSIRQKQKELTYPNPRLITLDTIYELGKMAAFADNNIGKIENPCPEDLRLLLDRFEYFKHKFSRYLEGMEMNAYIQDCLSNPPSQIPSHFVELFSLQCRALVGKLAAAEKNLKL